MQCLNEWEHLAPAPWRISAHASEDVLHNAIHAFSLTIGLRMIRCGHVQPGAKHLEEGLPKLRGEARVSIRDNCLRQAMLAKDSV
ncbi:hypothetical protein Pcac1_g28848 [Phytophthora cactorum]|nr:hypothetical protein Pcac1_g28848 [Phytophthora cactorum]KAG2974594.1 hypothetical protein PC119_g22656 [Phytophthora cactorum]KAG2976676.1 hypothetical protein PC120_g25650 [Phytophthora cactorum]KAG3122212.1 hypothetical protein C6341_g27058 [Phytophthora cactorum]KAG4038421.1 hypothetical protein PC123_g26011 [Phytophthora cactorum]